MPEDAKEDAPVCDRCHRAGRAMLHMSLVADEDALRPVLGPSVAQQPQTVWLCASCLRALGLEERG